MEEYNAKTVFLLNHTAHFRQNSGDEIVLDGSNKLCDNKRVFHKSIWSNVVDAVLQYCRIVYDVFSSTKPFSIITFDTEEKIHSIWLEEDQTIEAMWNIFSNEGPPVEFQLDLSKCDFMPGLEAACNMLQMLSPAQKVNKDSLVNVGRVIILGANMGNHIVSWTPVLVKMLDKTPESTEYAKVTGSEWLFIDLVTVGELDDQLCELVPQSFELPPDLISSPHRFLYHRLPTRSFALYRGLMRLVETHYDLASTLVQDIPMKEEANTNSSSAMYGVELIHSAEAHDLLRRIGLADQLLIRTDEEADKISSLQRPNSGFSKTLGIKWVTPKSADSGILRYTIAAHRVTLADVGNRASVCLAQFVLGGRSVALAHRLPLSLPLIPQSYSELLPAHSNNEALLLTCHGSAMYLHVLAGLCPLGHPPLVPLNDQGVDAQLPTELRLQPFITQLTRSARLAPASARRNYKVAPRERAQQHLERSTRYWPLFESETLLGNNKLANALFEHLPKEYLEPNEVVACTDSIDKLFSSLKHNMSLPSDTRKPGSKRIAAALPVAPSLQAEAIALAVELEHLLTVYGNLSTEHESLLQHWHTILASCAFGEEGEELSRENNVSSRIGQPFSSMCLVDLVAVGKKIASGQSVPPSAGVPEQLLQIISSMKMLCKQSTETRPDNLPGNKTGPQKGNWTIELGTSDRKDAVSIEPANHALFVQLLQPAKRPRLNGVANRLEFVGVTTADNKGMCQLYRALKDKEKEKTVT